MVEVKSESGSVDVKITGTTETIAADTCVAIMAITKSMWEASQDSGQTFELYLLSALPLVLSTAKKEANVND